MKRTALWVTFWLVPAMVVFQVCVQMDLTARLPQFMSLRLFTVDCLGVVLMFWTGKRLLVVDR